MTEIDRLINYKPSMFLGDGQGSANSTGHGYGYGSSMGFEWTPLFGDKKAYGCGYGYSTLNMGQADLTGGQYYTIL